jgi:hypothetical protein
MGEMGFVLMAATTFTPALVHLTLADGRSLFVSLTKPAARHLQGFTLAQTPS